MTHGLRSRCEVVMVWGSPPEVPHQFCDRPTVAGYEAMGGGWMALCVQHLEPHKAYVLAADTISALKELGIK